MKSKITLAICTAILAITAGPSWAHHSLAAIFDVESEFTVQGTLKDIRWINPHAYFLVDVQEEGQVVEYRFEGLPPGMMVALGMSRGVWMENIGKDVTVGAIAARNGSKLGFGTSVVFSDGKTWNIIPPKSEL